MSSAVLSRVARASLAGAQACRVRPVRALPAVHFRPAVSAFSTAGRKLADVDAHDPHHEESFEEFTARYAKRKTETWSSPACTTSANCLKPADHPPSDHMRNYIPLTGDLMQIREGV